MVKVLVVGAGRCFAKCVNLLSRLEKLRDCEIVAVSSVDNYSYNIYGWSFVDRKVINRLNFDCVYIAMMNDVGEIKDELQNLGIESDDIIPYDALFIPDFSFTRYRKLVKSRISIIANMCWGGVTYHYFCLPFLSPFINMFILDDDYLRLLRNLKAFVNGDLKFSHMETERFMKTQYPVFKINDGLCADDVMLHMNHYNDRFIGKEKWEQRVKRINYDNLLVMMYTENYETAEKFDSLPFAKKICLTNFESNLSSVCFLDIFTRKPLNEMPSWQMVSGLAAGRYVFYDPWEVLLDGGHSNRWC